ncbi:uncharacterized protein LOC128963182 isoform X2 [Oppia nitens]|uniref:uncharacterized protein LOC128963182 isoform X2 n=1 Tax=Oppia nitens TaxID=1686743 RepID=UPI0023DA47B6|nr:uncharacterized protein LOC128963182 isoform X2 [Oppia nitens]
MNIKLQSIVLLVLVAIHCITSASIGYGLYDTSDESGGADRNKIHPLFGPYGRHHFNTAEYRTIPKKTKPRVFIWKHRDHSAAEEAKKYLGLLAAQYEHSPGR